MEMATDFYDAEAYHQKWLLQRKAPLFRALELVDANDMLESATAARLNAFAGGAISENDLRNYLDKWQKDGTADTAVIDNIRRRLMMCN